MKPAEIALRLRQELAKRVDEFGLFKPSFAPRPVPAAARAGQFFFGKEDIPRRLALIRDNVRDFESTVVDHAEGVLNHRFSLLGYGPLDYGDDPDWQLDIVNGKRAPLKPWSKINYLDFNEVGDSKVTWEFSRHQFLVTLAKAWLLTGEERFLRKLEHLYYDWHAKNPYPLGINWASSLEVAFRSLSWIWVRELLTGCVTVAELRRDIERALAFNGWYIRRYLSTYFSPNTHLQGEAAALMFIGTLLPSLPNASGWRDIGWKILLEHALTKVSEEGAYFEQSTYYHVYALDFFLHARILAEHNGRPFPPSYDDVLKRMLRYLSVLCQAGPPPRFGDDDGGRVFDGRRNKAEHLSDPLAVGTALFQLNVLKQPGVEITEEVVWLLGEEGVCALSTCPEQNSRTAATFSHAGLYISPASEGCRDQVVLDAGPLGGGSGGHGHADALSLTLNLDGKPLLVDPGTFNYIGPGAERTEFRITRAHNTLMVDGLSQAEPRTAFSWSRWPEVTVEAIAFAPEFEFVMACHDGYTQLKSPVTHRRTLFSSHDGFWFVLDQLVTDGPHDYSLYWHLAPGSKVEERADGAWLVELLGSKFHLLTASDGWLSALESGWFSPAYGSKQSAPFLRLTKTGQGNEAIATVLWRNNLGKPIGALSRLSKPADMPAYRLKNGVQERVFIFGDGSSIARLDGWESDARFLYGLLGADGRPSRAVLVQATVARYRGKVLYKSPVRLDHIVWHPEDSL